MASGDDFWEKSDVKGYNFDDDESVATQMCGVSLGGTARLSQQIKAGLGSNQKEIFDAFPVHDDTALELELSQLVPQKELDSILEADNMEFSFSKDGFKSKDEELNILRRQVESRWSPPEIDNILQRILTGQPYSLELYRSLNSKKELLKNAVALGDGDAILMIVLFLANTLKKNLFYHILSSSPIAIQHYVTYLTTRMQIQEVTDLLEMLGNSRESSMKHFALACSNPQRQLQRLKLCQRNHFQDSKDKAIVDNFIRLLEWEAAAAGKPTGESVSDCLDYACRNHWDSKGSLSPLSLVQDQGVSERLFHWVALNARAGSWADIDNLIITKGWMGNKRVKTELPLERIVVQLHTLGAPIPVLMQYLDLITNADKKLETAKKVHCHRTIIDVYTQLKDKESILNYQTSLHPQSDDYFYAEQAIRTNTKWKN